MTALLGAGAPGEGPSVVRFLRSRGVRSLDILIVQTWSEEHCGGMLDILRAYRPKRVMINPCYTRTRSGEAFLKQANLLASRNRLDVASATPNERFVLFYAPFSQVTVVGPTGAMIQPFEGDPASSIVLEIGFGDISFLSLGQTKRRHQKTIWSQTRERPWGHILEIGRGGDAESVSEALLKPLRTRYAVIPIPKKGGRVPAPATLTALRRAGVKVYRTDRQGTITVVTDGKSVDIKTGT